jgi:hypothetical protein
MPAPRPCRHRPATVAGRPACLSAVLLLAAAPAVATDWLRGAEWLVAAGPTRSDGYALEVARSTTHWEVALGWVGEQRVNVRTEQDTCYAQPVGLPVCETLTSRTERRVPGYGYLSAQRRFTFRSDGWLKPVLGAGLVASTDTNPYVSSHVTFSLSAGMRFGERWLLEWRHFSNADLRGPNLGQDMLLLRGRW